MCGDRGDRQKESHFLRKTGSLKERLRKGAFLLWQIRGCVTGLLLPVQHLIRPAACGINLGSGAKKTDSGGCEIGAADVL